MKKTEYKIKAVDRILDPVHGFIDITKVEQEIMFLPIFKRMQGIKQLSMTNWIFPGAEHTRLIHSLGVMYIADQMALHIGIFDDGDRQLLRLAGLLHDIGHYPLSHVTESAYRDRLKKYDGSLKKHNDTVRKKVSDIAETKITEYMKSRYTDKMHHENVGASIILSDRSIRDIINVHCPFIDIDDICDIIVGYVERKKELSVFVQLLHSELDADGIDYIMRDASFSGTSYGAFEVGMLFRNLAVCEYDGIQIVGVRPKGIAIVDQYLINKYFSYTQVIFNRHVSIFNLMVEKATHELINIDESEYPQVDELCNEYIMNHENSSNYLQFNDSFFWTQIAKKEVANKLTCMEDYVATMIRMLGQYRELPMLSEFMITTSDKEKAKLEIEQSVTYKETKDNEILVFNTRGFTKEIPEEYYRKILRERWNKEHGDNLFEKTKVKRLQEGIAVVEDGTEPHLLVDDYRSITSELWKDNSYFLRRYSCEYYGENR